MLSKGPAKKVTIYVNEESQHHLGSLHEAILGYLLHHGVAGATATKAMAGFGAHQLMHTPWHGFTIADLSDRGMLDVVGFDTAAPAVFVDFVRE